MDVHIFVTIILITLSSVYGAKNDKRPNGSSSPQAKLLNSILKRYNNQQAPDTHNATQVQVFVHINRVAKIDNENPVLKMDIYLKQRWFDQRLRFPATSPSAERMLRLSPADATRLWHPDTFFHNMVQAREFSLPSQQKLTFLYSSGLVYTSHRMEVSIYCRMSFHKFPFDKQICPITLETLASNMGVVVLRWSSLYANAVELSPDLGLTNQAVTHVQLLDCTKQNYTSNAFPCLEMELVISRNLGLYLKHVYIPELLMICVCFLSFFIQTTLPRITLILVCAITMITHATMMTSQSPELSYYTGLDVWVTVQFVFLFVVVLEFGLVAAPRRWLPQAHNTGTRSSFYTPEGENGNGAPMEELMENHHSSGRHQKYVLTDAPTPARQKLDLMARFIIPLSYIGFNVAYWLYYCLL